MQATYIQKIESFTGVYVNPAQIDELSKVRTNDQSLCGRCSGQKRLVTFERQFQTGLT